MLVVGVVVLGIGFGFDGVEVIVVFVVGEGLVDVVEVWVEWC